MVSQKGAWRGCMLCKLSRIGKGRYSKSAQKSIVVMSSSSQRHHLHHHQQQAHADSRGATDGNGEALISNERLSCDSPVMWPDQNFCKDNKARAKIY